MVEYLKVGVFEKTFYTMLGGSFDETGNFVGVGERERLGKWAEEFFAFVQA